MKSRWRFFIPLGMFLLILTVFLTDLLTQRSRVSWLDLTVCESPGFRMQQLSPKVYRELAELREKGGDFGMLLTSSMLLGDFAPEQVNGDASPYLRYKKQEFYLLKSCYEAVWADLTYFPVASGEITFENTWLAKREYGGNRVHEGTDLFGPVKESGYYPIISMTDGTVEKIGWLPLGGYRIGIRSEHGGYFYYAHLSDYEKEFSVGDLVEAGEILGYMGNTGYGPEGTFGQFPVHLHLGIYIAAPGKEEISVNPYWVLRAVDKNIINYSY